MTFRNTRSSPMRVPSGGIPENIVSNIHVLESYVLAQDPFAHHQPQAAELSTQPNFGPHQQKLVMEQPINVLEAVPFCFEIHSLLLNKLSPIGVSTMNEAMMQCIEETITEAFEPRIQATCIEIKSAFFCFLEMTSMD